MSSSTYQQQSHYMGEAQAKNQVSPQKERSLSDSGQSPILGYHPQPVALMGRIHQGLLSHASLLMAIPLDALITRRARRPCMKAAIWRVQCGFYTTPRRPHRSLHASVSAWEKPSPSKTYVGTKGLANLRKQRQLLKMLLV